MRLFTSRELTFRCLFTVAEPQLCGGIRDRKMLAQIAVGLCPSCLESFSNKKFHEHLCIGMSTGAFPQETGGNIMRFLL